MLDPGDGGDRRLIDSPADGDRPGCPLGVGRQPLDPQHERIAQTLRRGAASVEARREQLLGVQRVPLAAGEQPLDEPFIWSVAEDVRQGLGQLRPVERCEVDAPNPLEPFELGEQRTERVAAMQFIATEREQNHEALLPQAARQERHKRPR